MANPHLDSPLEIQYGFHIYWSAIAGRDFKMVLLDKEEEEEVSVTGRRYWMQPSKKI